VGKHSPNSFDKYFEIHARCLESLKASGVVCSETLEIQQLDCARLRMAGLIRCRGNLELKVDKLLKLERTPKGQMIQAVKYSYNLRFFNGGNIFRYDNAHVHAYLGHQSPFHVHRFNPMGLQLSGSPIELPDEEDWPTLTEVLEEADEFYWAHVYSVATPSLEL
jgi:hypothetical protein